ncbi:AcrR family transcriptional regulator [Catenulispora sp. GAS73]|uniref:TetR/AcrR family transcriptional regulator n=1 Tax=Catenulispora sp. GAS73 TaxID=3156269 RepID=UPI0035150AEA
MSTPPTSTPAPAHRSGRRAGRRKTEVLQAAVRVLAERGAEGTRFQDVSAASGVPVSTLQYYFGSREDLLIAAFKHASETETARLHEELAQVPDPWDRLVRIIETVLEGCRPEAPESGRVWIESWRYGMRDEEMRQDVLRDYNAWRTLIADAIRVGMESGAFAAGDPEPDAIVILSLLDGIGLPTALGDPAVSMARARELMLTTMARLLQPAPDRRLQ